MVVKKGGISSAELNNKYMPLGLGEINSYLVSKKGVQVLKGI